MTPTPLVSCVLTTYNYADYVARSIESVLGQDYPGGGIELIVVDDGSTDHTPAVVEPYLDRIKYIRKENGGVCSANNRGFDECTGEFVTLQAADDEWAPDKARRQVELLLARPEVGLVYGDLEVIDAGGATLHDSFFETYATNPQRGRILGPLLVQNFVPGGAMMFRRSLLERVHPIPEFIPWEDWWIALRVAEVAEIDYLDGPPVYRYRRHGENMSLEAQGDNRIGLLAKELPMRRWLLRELSPGEVEPVYATTAIGHMLAHLGEIAAHRGVAAAEVAAAGTEERGRARELAAAAAQAFANADLDAGCALAANAIGTDPCGDEARVAAAQAVQAVRAALNAPASAPTGLRAFTTLASAAEVAANPALLAAYARAFSASDDATLLVYAPDWPIERAERELGSAVAAGGLDSEHAADVLAHVVPRSQATEELLAETAGALLSELGQLGAFARLPRFGAGDVERLRAAASAHARS